MTTPNNSSAQLAQQQLQALQQFTQISAQQQHIAAQQSLLQATQIAPPSAPPQQLQQQQQQHPFNRSSFPLQQGPSYPSPPPQLVRASAPPQQPVPAFATVPPPFAPSHMQFPVSGSAAAPHVVAVPTQVPRRSVGDAALELTCMNECEEVANAEARDMLVLAHIKAGAAEEQKERAPVSITAVIDRSGSMSGNKINLLKQTMEFVIGQLKETDKFGVIAYDGGVQECLPLTAMSPQGKRAALGAVQQIQAGGSTNLSGGLFAGLQQQKQAAPQTISLSIGNEYELIGNAVHKWSVYVRMEGNYIDNVQFLLPESFTPNSVTVDRAPFHLSRTTVGIGQTVQVVITFRAACGGQTVAFPHVVDCDPTNSRKKSFTLVNGRIVGSSAAPVQECVSTVWMLTDGEATDGITDAAQLATATKNHLASMPNTTLYTFGFGSDHKAKLLQELAAAGSGVYYYVEKAADIGDSFAEVLGGLVSVVAQKVVLRLEVPAPAKLIKVMTSYPTTTDGNVAVIQLRDLYADEERDVVALVRLPAVDESSKLNVANWQLAYTDVESKAQAVCKKDQTVGRPAVARSAPPPRLLDQQRNRLKSTAAMEKARSLADSNQLEEAKQLLNVCIAEITQSLSAQDESCVRLVADLRALLGTMVSRPAYQQQGQYAMNAMFQAYNQQRSAGQWGQCYATPQQAQCQQVQQQMQQMPRYGS